MLFSCMELMYSCGTCICFVCFLNYYVMVRCNDIHLPKEFQYAGLSLVGPSSSFRIGSHIGRDKLVSEPRPTIGAPLIDRVVWPLSSLEKTFLESSYTGE